MRGNDEGWGAFISSIKAMFTQGRQRSSNFISSGNCKLFHCVLLSWNGLTRLGERQKTQLFYQIGWSQTICVIFENQEIVSFVCGALLIVTKAAVRVRCLHRKQKTHSSEQQCARIGFSFSSVTFWYCHFDLVWNLKVWIFCKHFAFRLLENVLF